MSGRLRDYGSPHTTQSHPSSHTNRILCMSLRVHVPPDPTSHRAYRAQCYTVRQVFTERESAGGESGAGSLAITPDHTGAPRERAQ